MVKIEVLCEDVAEERLATENLKQQETDRKKANLSERQVSGEDTQIEETIIEDTSLNQNNTDSASTVENKIETTNVSAPATKDTNENKGLKKGFLEDAEALYPNGSEQGHVSEEQKKKWQEKEMNDKMNEKLGFGGPDSECEKPEWYTYDWPKGCQYNKPDCHLKPLSETKHASDLHKEVARRNDKWKNLVEDGNIEQEIRLCFTGINDEDLEIVLNKIRDSDIVKTLDLTHNNISDKGAQTLAGVLTNKGLPNLKDLKIHHNKLTEFGEIILSQGLKILRKDIVVELQDPLEKYVQNMKKQTEPIEKQAESVENNIVGINANDLD